MIVYDKIYKRLIYSQFCSIINAVAKLKKKILKKEARINNEPIKS